MFFLQYYYIRSARFAICPTIVIYYGVAPSNFVTEREEKL